MQRKTNDHEQRTAEGGITIRRLGETDAEAVRRLAGRDSEPVPAGDLLGLEIEGRLVAMQPLAEGGAVIADPFARTAEVRALLELRTAQLRSRARRNAPRSRVEGSPDARLHPLALARVAS